MLENETIIQRKKELEAGLNLTKTLWNFQPKYCVYCIWWKNLTRWFWKTKISGFEGGVLFFTFSKWGIFLYLIAEKFGVSVLL